MTYQPPRQESQFNVGERVVGKLRFVKVSGKKAVKVLWRDGDETKSTIVLLENCFEEVQEDLIQINKSGYDGEFQISLSTDQTSVVNFHPANGQFKVVVDNFPSAENEDPKPKVYSGKYGDMVKFNTVLRILKPSSVKGLTLPMQLFYEKWVPIESEDGEQVVGFSSPPGNSKHCDMLSDFCDATGVWKFGEMEWSQNILPEVEKRVLRVEKPFNVVLNDGWVESIYPEYDYEEESSAPEKEDAPWDEEEEMEVSQDEEEMLDPDWD